MQVNKFDGAEYIDSVDNERLTGQLKRIYDCCKDGNWRTLSEIEQTTGDPSSSISAQLRNLRKERFGNYQVEKRARGDRSHGLFEYRLLAPLPAAGTQLKLGIKQ